MCVCSKNLVIYRGEPCVFIPFVVLYVGYFVCVSLVYSEINLGVFCVQIVMEDTMHFDDLAELIKQSMS